VAAEVIIALDRSSSMLASGAWTWVRDATLHAIRSRDHRSAFGLRQFPSNDECAAEEVMRPVANAGESIAEALSPPTILASTPVTAALSGLETAFGDPSDGQAVLLITDGDESCSTQDDAVRRASALFRLGTRVYVIAVTTTANRSFLDRIAAAGGTGSSRATTDGSSMARALDEVFADLGTCLNCDGFVGPRCEGYTLHYCDGERVAELPCGAAGCGLSGTTSACLRPLGEACDGTAGPRACHPDQRLACVQGTCQSTCTWTPEVADSPVSVLGLSAAVDGAGKMHVAYQDGSSLTVRYATNAEGSWRVETVDLGPLRRNPSLAVDATAKAHIHYIKEGTLPRYATNVTGTWRIETAPGSGGDSSIAVDAAGKAHLCAFIDGLFYFTNASGSWASQDLDRFYGSINFCSVALDRAGKVHISYRWETGVGYTEGRVASNESGSWQISHAPTWGPLAVDSSGKLHIAGQNGYATNVSGSWEWTPIEPTSATSIALDPDGRVHIGGADGASAACTHNRFGVWQTLSVEPAQTGGYVAAAVSGEVFLAYGTDRELKVARLRCP
jgi:hypothetical protein